MTIGDKLWGIMTLSCEKIAEKNFLKLSTQTLLPVHRSGVSAHARYPGPAPGASAGPELGGGLASVGRRNWFRFSNSCQLVVKQDTREEKQDWFQGINTAFIKEMKIFTKKYFIIFSKFWIKNLIKKYFFSWPEGDDEQALKRTQEIMWLQQEAGTMFLWNSLHSSSSQLTSIFLCIKEDHLWST